MRFLTASVAALALGLLSSSCITSSHPIGTEPAADVAAMLDGPWTLGEVLPAENDLPLRLDPESSSTVIFHHRGGEDVWVANVNGEANPAIEVGEGVVRMHDGAPFLSLRRPTSGQFRSEPSRSGGSRYIFLRLVPIDRDTVVLDGPDGEVFRPAIDRGELEGRYDATSPVDNVELTGGPGAVERFFATPAGRSAMVSVPAYALVRLHPGPIPAAAVR